MAKLEEWKTVPGFSRYQISDIGRLRKSLKDGRLIVIKPGITSNGYIKYGLSDDGGVRHTLSAHRLVAISFLSPPTPEENYVLHENDDKTDNRVENLRWGTALENTADARKNNRLALGDRHPCHVKPWTRPRGQCAAGSKLTDDQVRSIMSDTRKQREIAAHYGVDQALIGRIRNGKVWRHITDPSYREFLRDRTKEISNQ